jgi:hypothetical protein
VTGEVGTALGSSTVPLAGMASSKALPFSVMRIGRRVYSSRTRARSRRRPSGSISQPMPVVGPTDGASRTCSGASGPGSTRIGL